MNDKVAAMPLTLILFLLVVALGVSFTMIGPIMPDLLERYGLKLAEGGSIVAIQNLSGLAAVILCGLFGDRFNKKVIAGLGIGLFVLSLLGLGLSPGFGLLMAFFFVFGIGSKTFDTLSNAIISDMHGNRRSLYLNLLHSFFGIGAFLGPMFVYSLSRAGLGWDKAFLYLGYFIAAGLVLYTVFAVTRRGGPSEGTKTEAGGGIGLASVFAHPRMWVLGFIILIHMGVLGVMITWLPLFTSGFTGAGAFMSSFALSALWIGIILSRILISRFSQKLGEIFMIRWGSLISLFIFVPALIIGDVVILTIAAGFMGLFIGFTIPFLMSVGCGWYPDKSAAVSSMLFIFGYFSVAVFPWASGLLGDRYGLIAAMSLVAASLMVLFCISWFLPGRDILRRSV